MTRTRNERLAALLAEAGWSRAQAASAFNRVAREIGDPGGAGIGRSHISMWVGGTKPSGNSPLILSQALSRRLLREVSPDELGFAIPAGSGRWRADWSADPLADLADLGRIDLDTDPRRRSLLAGAVYSAAALAQVAALALPDEAAWRTATLARTPSPGGRARRIGRDDVLAVQQLTAAFSQIDQRLGGGHGRKALVQYLNSDVATMLRGRFGSEQVRRDIFSAAGELAYLAGWTAFDTGEQPLAQRYFHLALKLTAQAQDPPLAGHILRAMANQAVELGLPDRSLDLATASIAGQRYLSASPKQRALLGVLHARGLAATGDTRAASKALLKAEDDLASASADIAEPQRTFFVEEASLAQSAGRVLRDCDDHRGAVEQFQRSVQTRGAAFRRTHAVTLADLGAAQFAVGAVDEACDSWGVALGVVQDGVRSWRARKAIAEMRTLTSAPRYRRLPAVADLRARARAYLAQAS